MKDFAHYDQVRKETAAGRSLLQRGKLRPALRRLLIAQRHVSSISPEAISRQQLGEWHGILRQLGMGLADAAAGLERPRVLARAQTTLWKAGLHRGPMARAYLQGIVSSPDAMLPSSLSVYLDYVEGGGRLGPKLRRRVYQALHAGLHVRLSTPLPHARRLVPALLRLHRLRPQLTFPRLALGRWHYLEQRFDEAEAFLSGIQGKLRDKPKVLNVRARCAERSGLMKEAEKLYRRSLDADRYQAPIHFRLGRLYLNQYRRAIGLDATLLPLSRRGS